jgi:transposase-like protein
MKLAEEVKRGIAADRKAGMSVKEVSAKYGVNKSTIAKYARAAEEVQSVEVPTTLDLEVDLSERAKMLDSEPPPMKKAAAVPAKTSKAVEAFIKSALAEEAPAPAPAPAVELPRGDPKELVQRILLNAETFPEVFPNPPTQSSLAGKGWKELDEVLKSMEHSRAVRMLSVQMKQVFFVASRATEVLGKAALKLKTDGMTDALMTQTKELDYLFRELAIKHASKFSGTSEPEVRLLMLFGMTLLQTDATNRLRERMPASAPTETAEKYADL